MFYYEDYKSSMSFNLSLNLLLWWPVLVAEDRYSSVVSVEPCTISLFFFFSFSATSCNKDFMCRQMTHYLPSLMIAQKR